MWRDREVVCVEREREVEIECVQNNRNVFICRDSVCVCVSKET